MSQEQVADEQREWFEDSADELPRRPRRRLLGAGGNPIPLALIGVLLVACGFIGGVLVEKGQGSPDSSTAGGSGLASRFASLRGATGANAGGSASGGPGSTGGPAAGLFSSNRGAGSAVLGQVSYVSGHTLYVENSEGNTVKVTTSAASTVSKTVKSEVKAIHPGETVIVTGSRGTNGAVSAESIRVGEAGASVGLGAIFGGNAGTRRGSGAGEPALFGK
jgi:hypothetical protein